VRAIFRELSLFDEEMDMLGFLGVKDTADDSSWTAENAASKADTFMIDAFLYEFKLLYGNEVATQVTNGDK